MPDVPVFRLIIEFSPGQPVKVSGPINEKMMCYGMLEMARDAIKDYVPPQIQIAPPDLLSHIQRHDYKKHPN